MAFIKYTERGRSYAAKASISKVGMLSFTEGARRRFHLDNYKFCVLYYDPETLRIGIELTSDEGAEGIRKIRFRETGADVAIKSILDFFAIGIVETTSYPIEKDEESGMVVIDLRDGVARKSRQTREG